MVYLLRLVWFAALLASCQCFTCNFPFSCKNGQCIGGTFCNCNGTGFTGPYCETEILITITSVPNGASPVSEGHTISYTFERTITNYSLTLVGTASGTADSDDYRFTGDVVFNTGDAMAQVILTILDDDKAEPRETIRAVFKQSGDTFEFPSVEDYTIEESDPIRLAYNSSTRSFQEDGGQVILSLACELPIGTTSLPLTATLTDGTATLSEDYSLLSQGPTCSSLPKDIAINIVNDNKLELPETFTITISSNLPVTGDTAVTFTIIDDDELKVTSTTTNKVSESVGAFTLSFTFVPETPNVAIPITVTIAGKDAIENEDFIATPATKTFSYSNTASLSELQAISVTIINDDNPEPHKSLSITLTSPYNLAGSTNVETRILDDDPEEITVTGPSVLQEDDSTVAYTLTRTTAFHSASVSYTVTSNLPSGSTLSPKVLATSGQIDFTVGQQTAPINVTLIGDDIKETDQTFKIEFTTVSGRLKPISPLTVTVQEDDDYGVSFSGGTVSEGDTYTMTFTRDSTVGALTIRVTTMDGTALAGVDYTAVTSRQLTFPDGTAELTTDFDTTENELFETDKTFTVIVTSDTPLKAVSPATITIANDDDYGVSFSGGTVSEGDTYTMTFTRDSTVGALTIRVTTIDGTALAGVDYTAVTSRELTFPVNRAELIIDLDTIEDTKYEENEIFTVTFTSDQPLKTVTPAIMTIGNDDVEEITVTVEDTKEDAGSISVLVSRTADFETLDFKISTLIPSVSYPISADDIIMLTEETKTFLSGTTTVTVQIGITNDNIPEPDEVLTVSVDAPDPIVDKSTSVTLINDDPDVITVDTFLGLMENGASKRVTITRTVDDKEVTVQVTVNDVTAKAGTDFTVDSTATFAAGSLTTTFSVNVEDDQDEEGDETFTITISGDLVKTIGPLEFVIADNEGSRPFDCRRKNQDCNNANDACFQDFPFCQCMGSPQREGKMCNIVTDQKNGAGCTSTCNNNGVCLSDSGAVSCACYPGYYGDECSHYFLKAECSTTSMRIIANPHGNFDGKIYVKGKFGESDCTAGGVPDPPVSGDGIDDTLRGYLLDVPHDSSACEAISPVEGATETSYSRKFIIQYDSLITTQLDQCVTLTCKFDRNNLLVDAGVVTIDSNGPFTEESTSNVFSPLSLVIADISGVPVTEATLLPISKKLCVTLSIPVAFGGLEILDIEFNNSRDDDPKRWQVFTAGCSEVGAKSVFADIPFYVNPSNKRVKRFCFFAFKFMNSDKLAAKIKVKICLNPDDCNLETCGKRRRRQAGGETETTTVGAKFTIVDPSQQTTDPPDPTGTNVPEVTTDDTCHLPIQFLPTVLCLGTLVLVLVLIIMYLTYRLVRRSKKPDALPEPDYPFTYPIYFKPH